MKTISVVLTRYPDTLSRLLCLITGFGYSHASISLEENADEMYSFNFKGFCIENRSKHRRRGVRLSQCIQLRVGDDAYARLQQRISSFIAHRNEYSYTRLGVFFSLMHIPFRRKNRYFCSQFVAEMLSDTGAVPLKKAPSLYMPNHFLRELAASSQLMRITSNPI